jgi:hypothetical protein
VADRLAPKQVECFTEFGKPGSRVSVVEPGHPQDAPQGDSGGHEPFPTVVITTKFENLLAITSPRRASTPCAAALEAFGGLAA